VYNAFALSSLISGFGSDIDTVFQRVAHGSVMWVLSDKDSRFVHAKLPAQRIWSTPLLKAPHLWVLLVDLIWPS